MLPEEPAASVDLASRDRVRRASAIPSRAKRCLSGGIYVRNDDLHCTSSAYGASPVAIIPTSRPKQVSPTSLDGSGRVPSEWSLEPDAPFQRFQGSELSGKCLGLVAAACWSRDCA